jgi:leucyl-tRNA synthetase
MSTYDFTAIEARWQAFWLEQQSFRCLGPGEEGFDPSKPKYYVLDMFPYPSGAGLHVGHPKGYTATDITARYKRHRGFNVLHPMGWDAFGLPAEQYAIQTGTHPAKTTAKNVDQFRRQLQALGFSYDWAREVNTTDPNYYRWTQWIFNRLFERGLAYQAEVPVWWCEALGTVLANEEVIDGMSERGSHPCVRKPLRQWMLRITEYADRLLDDLEGLDWPESVKAMQREWIGRSVGAEISFATASASGAALGSEFTVFTTRPDTLFGASFCVLSPEHPLVSELTTPEHVDAVAAYQEQAARKSELERAELQKEKTGVFTGSYALNPAFPEGDPQRLIPVWIADYVLMSYGTGAIMCVPDGDERDREFAEAYGLSVPQVLEEDGTLCNSEFLNGLTKENAVPKMVSFLEEQKLGTGKVNYRLRDWLFSRQRYWGEPFPVLHELDAAGEDTGMRKTVADGDLPVTLPELEDFTPTASGDPPLARAEDWVQVVDGDGKVWRRETNSMPQWAGSCWYYLRFMDPHNDQAAWEPEIEKYWMPVDLYVGGAEHAVLHLLYARFWHKVLFDAGLVSTSEPFQSLVNQGMVQSYAFKDARGALVPIDEVEETQEGEYQRQATGDKVERLVAKMSKSLKNVINPDDVIQEYGADTMRLYEAFMGPVTASAPWNPRDLPGVHRFLQRVWRLFDRGAAEQAPEEVTRALHRAIKKVGDDLEQMNYNTAIAAMMEFVNAATKSEVGLTEADAQTFCILLEPFAPHLAEELWAQRNGAGALADAPWPAYDEAWLKASTVEIPVQVNGKLRGKAQVAADADRDAIEGAAREVVAEHLEGTIRKVVVVPGRLVNFVVA